MLTDWMPKSNDKVNKIIGENLRSIRKAFQMTQTDVAKHLNVSPQQIYKYEEGKNNITSQNLAKLSQLFGCDMEFFLLHGTKKDEQKNNEILMISEKKKTLSIKKKRKHSEIIDMLKSYMTLDDEEKQQVKNLIDDLQKQKKQSNKKTKNTEEENKDNRNS